MSARDDQFSSDELAVMHASEGMLRLRADKDFQRFLGAMQTVVDSARTELEHNQDPRFDAHLARVYRERLRVVQFAAQYMENVISKRRNAMKELFQSMGVPEELHERNQDMSLSFLDQLLKRPEAHDENQNTSNFGY